MERWREGEAGGVVTTKEESESDDETQPTRRRDASARLSLLIISLALCSRHHSHWSPLDLPLTLPLRRLAGGRKNRSGSGGDCHRACVGRAERAEADVQLMCN